MKIEIKIDSDCTEPKIIILTDQMTEEIQLLIRKISEETSQVLAGFCEDKVEILDSAQIIRIYAEAGKVFAQTDSANYALRLRLYELENRLGQNFVRISNSEIVNLKLEEQNKS